MNKPEAKDVVRRCIRALPDHMARNLMEHAANRTPIIKRSLIDISYVHKDAG